MKSENAKICGIIGNIVIVVGIIGALFAAYRLGVKTTISTITYDLETERDWVLTIIIFIIPAFLSIALGILFNAIKEALLYLEKIYSFEKNREEETVPASFKSSGNFWTCPKCGKENPNYTGTCGCGTTKA